MNNTSAKPNNLSSWIGAITLAVVTEGALRKWVLPAAAQPLAFLAKDAIAIAFILTHPIPRPARGVRRIRECFFFVAVALLPAFIHGLMQNWQGAVINYKNAFLWGVLAVHLAPQLDIRTVNQSCRWLAPLTIGMAMLGVIQYGSGADAFVNRYAWSALDPSTQVFGYAAQAGGVRATGTFSFISGMSSFSVFTFVIFLWRFAKGVKGSKYWVVIAGMVAAICCGLTSGSRSTSVVFGAALCITILFSHRVKAILHLAMLLGCASLFFIYFFDQHVLTSFAERWRLADAQDYGVGRATGEGLRGNYFELISNKPWGLGLGQQSNLAEFRAQQEGATAGNYDHGGTRGIAEAGLLGLLAQCTLGITALTLLIRGLFSKIYEQRLCSATLGSLAAYWLFSCDWHDHNTAAMSGLLLAMWLSLMKTPQGAPMTTPQLFASNNASVAVPLVP